MTRWFDSHCHIQDDYLPGADEGDGDGEGAADLPYAERVRATLTRAAAVGVIRMVCIGTDGATSRQALALAREVRQATRDTDGDGDGDGAQTVLWATAGQHPHEASSGTAEVAALVAAECASADGVLVAVGECGLDYHYEHSPRQAQREAFAEQIALAHRHRMALVVHAREAWDDLFDVLAAEGVPERTVLHCFTGGPAEARRCLDAGMFISFSGIVTFKNAADVRAAAEACPLDRLLVETDAPFLAPVPHRGRPNEPSLVPLVGAVVAELKGVDPEVVAEASWRGAHTAFAV